MKLIHFASAILIASLFSACGEEPNGGGTGGDNPPTPPAVPNETAEFRTVKVLEYLPAPGQFVNEIPEYETGDSEATMIAKATQSLNKNELITLGSLGGSVTLKLDKPIKNNTNAYDFRVVGNCFYGIGSTDTDKYGSAEAGIIYVMKDENSNGVADDKWYEIKGSVDLSNTTITTITYHRPSMEESGTVTNGYITNPTYIKWEMPQSSESGYIMKITEHEQTYYPAWKADNSTISKANIRRLPNNATYDASILQYKLKCFDYGYADNQPNNVTESKIKIDWAIDENGKSVSLSQIDFIKVVSAIINFNGTLGETSTEISGIESFK